METGEPKNADCIRVDGAGARLDHEEVGQNGMQEISDNGYNSE